jgi:hypothetical protein
MRAAIGPGLAHLTLLGAGFGILYAIGVLRDITPRRLLAAAGLAYLTGVSVVMLVLIALLVIGVPLSLPLFVGLSVVFALPVLLGLRHRSAWTGLRLREGLRGLDLEGRIVAGIVVAVAIFAVVGIYTAGVRPLTEFDAWQLWTRKALLLFYDPHLPVEVLTSKVAYVNVQPDYPLLLPVLEAVQFRAGGRPDTQEAHATTWLLCVAATWALAYVASRCARPFVWIGVPAGVVVLLGAQAVTGYADVPVAGFLGVGTLAVGFWLQSGHRSDLALGAIMLGGAAATKNEGLVGAAIVFGVAVVTCVVPRLWRAAAETACAGALTAIAAIVPWRAWMAAHDVSGTLAAGDGLNPAYLVDHFDRVWPSIRSIAAQLVTLPVAEVTVAIGIAIALVRIRSLPRLAAFYLGVGLLYFMSLVWAYWISPLPLVFHIVTSVDRVVFGLALIAVAAILHLGQSDVAPAEEGPPETPELPTTSQSLTL